MQQPVAAAIAAAFIGVAALPVSAAVIEEIEVTATPLGEVLQPTDVLNEADLLLKRQPTIGETLASEPGVNSSYFGPASSRPIIRGLGGSRVKVLRDAVASLDVSDVSADHAVTVEPVLARGVEIIRGPATLLYGSQAAGGVVNVLDGRVPIDLPADRLDGALEIRGDSASSEEAVVGRLDAALGPLAVHLDGVTRETDDLEIPGFATAEPARRPPEEEAGTLRNSASETDSYAGGLSWVFPDGYLGLAVSRLENSYGLPGPEVEEAGADEPALYPGPFLDMEQTRLDLRGELQGGDWLEKLKLAFGTNDYEHAEIEPSGEVATLFDNEAWQGRVELVHREIAGFRGAVGLQIDERDFAALGEEAFVQPVQTESWGVFAAEQLNFDWGRLELGLRADELEHRPLSLSAYDDSALSAAAGLMFRLTGDLELRANLSRTERLPAAEELYSEGPHIATRQFEIGLLAPAGTGRADTEKSMNLDLGLRRTGGTIGFDLAVFYNDIGDYIYQDLSGEVEDDLPVALYRQADAEFWGIEAELRLSLEDRLPLMPEFRLFADFVDAELDDGRKLPRIPPLRIGFGAGLGGPDWGVDLDLVYHDRQNDISSFATGDYTMLDVGGWYRAELDELAIELYARGTNLLDEEARKSTSFLAAFAPLPGISAQAGLRLLF